MSDLIPIKEFDQLSCTSLKSQISNLQFQSPLPLPQNAKKIPTNDEIGQSYDEMVEKFPEINIDQMVQVLYHNVITPQLLSKSSEVYTENDDDDVKSHYSSISKASSLRSELLKFKVHPNETHFKSKQKMLDEEYDEDGVKIKQKWKRPSKAQQTPYFIKRAMGKSQDNLKKARTWTQTTDKQHTLGNSTTDKQFSTKEEEVKYEQKKLAAKAFCDRGQGLDKLKEEVWEQQRKVLAMQKKKYIWVCNAFLSESYRRLQKFLVEDCKRNIKPLTSPEMRALIPILMKSQLKFEEDQYLTLRKFIRVTYDLGSVSIFEQMAVKLYIRIQLCLRGRIGAMKLDRQYRPEQRLRRQILRSPGRFLNQRLEAESIWTRQLEHQLIDNLLTFKTIAKTRDKFKQKYGINATLNNVKQLKARFFKILRIATKRLIKLAAQCAKSAQYTDKIPHLMPVDDQKVKVLIRHHSAQQARFALIRFYKVNGFDQKILTQAIQKVNQFCYVQQKRRQNQEVPKQPIINSVTDKIKHNIKVSRKLLKNVTLPAERVQHDGDLLFLKEQQQNYQHIVSLQHNDKLHYFRKTGVLNNKGGYQYLQKPPQLKKLQMQDGDDDSEQLVLLSDDDYDSVNDDDDQQSTFEH